MTDPRRSYALEMIELDPRIDVGAIIAKRRAFVGTPTEADHAAPDADEEERERVADALKMLRESFWSIDAEETRRRLAHCNTAPFPDLARSAARIESVNAIRDQFVAIREHPQIDDTFADSLEAFVLATPRERVRLGERIEGQAVRRGKRVWERSAKHVRKRFPAVAELVPAWIEGVEKLRKDKKLARKLVSNSVWTIIGVWILIRMIIRLFFE